MLQIVSCTHKRERDCKDALCTACDVRNILIRMGDTIDRRTPPVSPAN